MSELNASNLRKEHGNEGPDLVGVTELTSPYYMVPPSGTTAERPQNPQKGTLRFNTDIGSLEYFKGDTIGWEQIVRTTPNLGGGTGSNTGNGARGLICGGYDADSSSGQTRTNIIDYITLSTLGNAQDFGDMVVGASSAGATASSTRFIKAGGYMQGSSIGDQIDYNTFSSTGDAIDFGDLLNNDHQYAPTGTGDKTRGLCAGGLRLNVSPYTDTNVIQYNTIASTGDSVDYGDLTEPRTDFASCNNSTRSLFIAGSTTPVPTNIIDYVTTQTLGDAADFGDLINATVTADSGCSNSIRGLVFGGRSPSNINNIDYITIATLGNSIDFGDMLHTGGTNSATSSSTRATEWNDGSIDYVEIMTTGNAKDFGDMITADYTSACSNAHGGL